MSDGTNIHEMDLSTEEWFAPAGNGRSDPDFLFEIARLDTGFQDSGTAMVLPRTVLMEQLSDAIANRFNNLMMAISSQADVELKKNASAPGKRSWELILSNASKATCLIQKLVFLGRKASGSEAIDDLSLIVEDLTEVFQAIVGEDVLLSIELNPNIGRVKADRSQLEYLLLSIVAAFCTSLPEGGNIKLTSQLGGSPRGHSLPEGKERSDSYAILSVEVSSGTKTFDLPDGFSERASTLEHKRFASELAASGVGVDEAHGYIAVHQGAGGSTKLELYLLRLEEQTIPPLTPLRPVISNAKTVLIVEDDSAVRRPASEFLKMEGFKVLQARNGAEALAMLQQNQASINLLVTDMNMAEINGHELAERLKDQYPSMKVLFMSGDISKLHDEGKTHLPSFTMQKPFRLGLLIERVHDLLRD